MDRVGPKARRERWRSAAECGRPTIRGRAVGGGASAAAGPQLGRAYVWPHRCQRTREPDGGAHGPTALRSVFPARAAVPRSAVFQRPRSASPGGSARPLVLPLRGRTRRGKNRRCAALARIRPQPAESVLLRCGGWGWGAVPGPGSVRLTVRRCWRGRPWLIARTEVGYNRCVRG